MTPLQQSIVKHLLDGCTIADCHTSGYRLRSASSSPIRKFYASTFFALKPLLRRTKKGLYVINKNEVRQLHGASLAKKFYKKKAKK